LATGSGGSTAGKNLAVAEVEVVIIDNDGRMLGVVTTGTR
jgi:hypothetical protein